MLHYENINYSSIILNIYKINAKPPSINTSKLLFLLSILTL